MSTEHDQAWAAVADLFHSLELKPASETALRSLVADFLPDEAIDALLDTLEARGYLRRDELEGLVGPGPRAFALAMALASRDMGDEPLALLIRSFLMEYMSLVVTRDPEVLRHTFVPLHESGYRVGVVEEAEELGKELALYAGAGSPVRLVVLGGSHLLDLLAMLLADFRDSHGGPAMIVACSSERERTFAEAIADRVSGLMITPAEESAVKDLACKCRAEFAWDEDRPEPAAKGDPGGDA